MCTSQLALRQCRSHDLTWWTAHNITSYNWLLYYGLYSLAHWVGMCYNSFQFKVYILVWFIGIWGLHPQHPHWHSFYLWKPLYIIPDYTPGFGLLNRTKWALIILCSLLEYSTQLQYVTGPAKIDHVRANYTELHFR